jgi:hypothetical protein
MANADQKGRRIVGWDYYEILLIEIEQTYKIFVYSMKNSVLQYFFVNCVRVNFVRSTSDFKCSTGIVNRNQLKLGDYEVVYYIE